MLTREDFLKPEELRTRQADIPGRGQVTVRELTMAERLEFEELANKAGAASPTALLVAASVIDAGGNRLFEWEDAATIDALPSARMRDVVKACRELSLVGPEAEGITEKHSDGPGSAAAVAGSADAGLPAQPAAPPADQPGLDGAKGPGQN